MEDGANDTARKTRARHAAVVRPNDAQAVDKRADASANGDATASSPRRFAKWLMDRAPGHDRATNGSATNGSAANGTAPNGTSAHGVGGSGAGIDGAGIDGAGRPHPVAAPDLPRPRPRPHPTAAPRELPPPPPPPPGSRPALSAVQTPETPATPPPAPSGTRPRPRPRPAADTHTQTLPAQTVAAQAPQVTQQPPQVVPDTKPAGKTAPKRSGPGFFKRHSKLVRRTFRIALVLALAVGAAAALRIWVVQPFYIPSQSMEPTLHGCPNCNDDRVLVDKLSYRSGDVSTHDIVVFHRPSTWQVSDDVLVKRVIGLPGDRIVIRSGFVYVNRLRTTEPYVKNTSTCPHQQTSDDGMRNPYTVPKGDVFVMGDNRCDSSDSRVNGPVPVSDIIGRAFMIIWPVNRITTL